MEETTGSWKSHGLTLTIFGGIVVLCSIFFVLGMLVGRNQGQHIAEVAFANQAPRKAEVESGRDDLPLTFYNQTTEEKPDLKLQTVPAPPPAPVASAPLEPTASKNAKPPVLPDPKADKSGSPSASATPAKASPQKTAAAKPPTPQKAAPPAPATSDVYVQLASTKTEKQATTELKKVQSKGYKGKVVPAKSNGIAVFRVMVGPYKQSEVKLVTSDLKAKGYKDLVVR